MCIYICIYMRMYIYMYMYMCMYMSMHMYTHMYIYKCMYIYKYMNLHMCMYNVPGPNAHKKRDFFVAVAFEADDADGFSCSSMRSSNAWTVVICSLRPSICSFTSLIFSF